MLAVHLVDHFLGVREVGIVELHSVPLVVVGAPILPVLHDTVEGYAQFAVLLDHAEQFFLALIALLRLEETIGPQRVHLHLTCQVAQQALHFVGRVTTEEVVIGTRCHLRGESHLHRIVRECGGRCVIPQQAVAFDRLQVGDGYLCIVLSQNQMLVALVHASLLVLAEAIDTLVAVELECLTHLVAVGAAVAHGSKLGALALLGQ